MTLQNHFSGLRPGESHPLIQDLLNYATESIGNGPDGGMIA